MTNEYYQQAKERLASLFCHNISDEIDWSEGWDNYSDWEKHKFEAFEKADQILSMKWDNGLPMFYVGDPEQELPKMYNETDEPISNFVERAVQDDMQRENWRKVVGK